MSFLPMPGYLAQPRNPYTWIVEDILPTSGLLNIYGKPKTHKSMFALQLAEAISNPEIAEVLGFPVHQHGKVAYLQLDTPRGIWCDRIVKFFPLTDNVLMADTETPGIPYPFNILGSGYGWLKEAVAAAAPLVVIIDTLREAFVGDENVSDHMQLVVSSFVSACRPSAIIFLSHARKNTPEGAHNLMDENRGSNYVSGRMDAVMALTEEKAMYQSRVAGLERFDITRTPLLHLKDPISAYAKRLVAVTPQLEMTQMVSRMRQRFPHLDPEAARSQLRRAKG